MHCEDELLSLLIKVDWPMAKQDLGAERRLGRKGRSERRCQETQREQDVKNIQGKRALGQLVNRNGLI